MRQTPPPESAPHSPEAPVASVKAALSNLALDAPTHFAGLTVFPLTSDLRSSARYLLLEEGLRSGLVSIREVHERGSVPHLAVENRSDANVLIVDGEEMVGAKQNRIANLTLLVAAKRTTTIPVSCVEAGRWGYTRPDFTVTERVQDSRGRAARLYSVQRSMRATGGRRSDQGAVWNDLKARADRMAVHSPTQAMSDIYDHHRATLSDYVRKLSVEPGRTGAIFVAGTDQFGMDLFDKHETFAAFFPKLVRSYAIDAMEHPTDHDRAAKPADARIFLDRLRNAAFDAHPAVALGHDVGAVARGAIAGALVHEGVALHLTAFSQPDAADRPERYASHRRRRDSLRRRHDRR